jgi:pimeloyl-ACP methyl ester carboxylesterase
VAGCCQGNRESSADWGWIRAILRLCDSIFAHADFELLYIYNIIEELEVEIGNSDVVLSSKQYPGTPQIEIKREAFPQGTKIRYEVVESIPSFDKDSTLAVAGLPVRLSVEAGGEYVHPSSASSKVTIRGPYNEGDQIECIGIFNGEVWIAFIPELYDGCWEIEVDLREIDVPIDGLYPVEVARFDDALGEYVEPQGIFDPNIDLYRWTSYGWVEIKSTASVKEEIKFGGGSNTFFLVHGFRNSIDSMAAIASYLSKYANLAIYGIDYGNIRGIEAQGDAFAEILKECVPKEERVNIIAHSMGGLVTRAAIELAGAESYVQKLLTLGTPHHGVPKNVITCLELNVFDKRVQLYFDISNTIPQARDLSEDSKLMKKMDRNKPAAVHYTFIAGNNYHDYELLKFTKYAYEGLQHDGLVSVPSALRYYADANERPDGTGIYPLNHAELRLDPMIMEAVEMVFGLDCRGTVTIVYHANGGSGAPASHTATKDSDGVVRYTLSEKQPTRPGYEFLGWRFENRPEYKIDQPGERIIFDTGKPDTDDVFTYYAQWKAK